MKTIISLYYDYLKNSIINDCFIGPVEKSNMIEKIIFIVGLYNDGFISGRECLHMLIQK